MKNDGEINIFREASLQRMIPDLFKKKTVFYIGAMDSRFDFAEQFKEGNYKITVLEIFKPNADWLKKIPWLEKVIHADIRDFTTNKKYDVVFWWHGPEHIEQAEIPQVLKKLEQMAKKYVILGCPWGEYPQGEEYGNIYEKHLSSLNYPFFENLGYKTAYLGGKNIKGSNITSVKNVDGL